MKLQISVSAASPLTQLGKQVRALESQASKARKLFDAAKEAEAAGKNIDTRVARLQEVLATGKPASAKTAKSPAGQTRGSETPAFFSLSRGKRAVLVKLYTQDGTQIYPDSKKASQRAMVARLSSVGTSGQLDTDLDFPYTSSAAPSDCFVVSLTEDDHKYSEVASEWRTALTNHGLKPRK